MKILLTGGSGFLGRHLVSLLEKNKIEIHHLVREYRGLQNEYLWDFSSPLPESIPVCDIVVHLAAYVDFGSAISLEQYKVNTVAAMKLGQYCHQQQAHFVLASMAGVHGEQELIDHESPIRPVNHYGMSKYLAEEVVRCFVHGHTIIRICGIYGLDGPAHLGLNNAISQAFHHGDVPVLKGSGRARRNYISVIDAAHWLAAIIDRIWSSQQVSADGRGEIVYMAGSEILSIAEYLQILVEVLLPGKEIIREQGRDSNDSIVRPSASPVSLGSFRGYLSGLGTG